MPDYARRVRVTPRATGPGQVLLSPFDAEEAPAYARPRSQLQRDAELGRELLRYVSFGVLCIAGGVLALLFLVTFMAGVAVLTRALPF